MCILPAGRGADQDQRSFAALRELQRQHQPAAPRAGHAVDGHERGLP